jgi:ribosomal protein S18 acetylase RimI-like enzyme
MYVFRKHIMLHITVLGKEGVHMEVLAATPEDLAFWESLDRHIARGELLKKIRDGRCFLIRQDGEPVGVMRYNLFWDSIPFLTMLILREPFRRMGLGRRAMTFWEGEMRSLGYSCVMTSTQSDEAAQHFYRALGYRDAGCLLLDIPPIRQPMEILLIKPL